MDVFFHHVALAAPLFALVLAGYVLMRVTGWSANVADGLTRFVFVVALPATLFRQMCDFGHLPPVDPRLLMAFFGGCLVVFVFGRWVAWRCFRLDGVGQSVFALAGVFSNNLMLGLPLAKEALGDAAVPSVALVLVFNSLTLWTLLTVSVEWARHGSLSLRGISRTLRGVLSNPLIIGILSGTLIGLSGGSLPTAIDQPLSLLVRSAVPLTLVALGMGLAQHNVRSGLAMSLTMAAIKLIVQPFAVWAIARLIGLPALETQVVVLLASIATGANVFLMSRQFKSLEGPVASCLVLSTALAAVTTPLALTLTS